MLPEWFLRQKYKKCNPCNWLEARSLTRPNSSAFLIPPRTTIMKTAVVAALASLGAAAAAPKPANEPFHGRYRISPVDGTKIALPTKEQLAFQDREIGFLIHFNIATYIQEDGCNSNQSLVPERKLFDPELLNTDQWMESAKDLGAKYATLVAKHNCGFTTWPSKVQFSDRDGNAMTYNYTVAQSPVSGKDVIRSFVDSTKKYGLGHGFYYSSVVNNYLNVYGSEARNEPLAPGQVGVTTETYNKVVIDQLTELWGQYGDLTEVGSHLTTYKNELALTRYLDLVRWWLQRSPEGLH